MLSVCAWGALPLVYGEDAPELAAEHEVVGLYYSCEMAGGEYVDERLDASLEALSASLAALYDQKLSEYGHPGGWRFSTPLMQELYDSQRELYAESENGEMVAHYELDSKEKFVQHLIYAIADHLIDSFRDKLYYSPAIQVNDLKLHLRGNEVLITIVHSRSSGAVRVCYERDSQLPEQPERVVNIDRLYALIPYGAKPYFQMPKDPNMVSCWVQQTGDHVFLFEIQNCFHCCTHTVATMRDGSVQSYRFWRDGQEMERADDSLKPEQNPSQFIRVYLAVEP